jgi:GAF domain-containing protein
MADEEPNELRRAHGTSGQSPTSGLASEFADLARDMQAEPDMRGLLRRIAEAAVREIDGAQHAGISLIEGDHIRSEAGTGPLVQRIDDLQYRVREGPCLTSLRNQVTVRSDDLNADDRWPKFAAAAVEEGIRSMLSVQLFVEGDNLGALNTYAACANAFNDEDESVAMLLASHASVAMKGSRLVSNLRIALGTRDTIGQAKGILMERYKLSQAEAFDLLAMASQRTHSKLHQVAAELAETGALKTE